MLRKFLMLHGALCLVVTPLVAQRTGGGEAFLATLGTDTIAVNRFARHGDTIQGVYLTRVPRLMHAVYTAVLTPGGSLAHVNMSQYASPGERLVRHMVAAPRGDSLVVEVTQDGIAQPPAPQALTPDAVPLMGNDYALWELALQRFLATRRDTGTMTVTFVAGVTRTVPLRKLGGDSIVMLFDDGDYQYFRVDRDGRMLGMRSPHSSVAAVVTRLPSVDIEAYERNWAARPLGRLSPADSVHATIGAAHVTIEYSRPRRRGRVIFGSVVEWGKVWRTGANAATSFTTDKDLLIGGTAIPAGSYTLWTMIEPDRTTLIISKETGQWGTEYKPEHDFAHIPMTVIRQTPPLEEFTISVVKERGRAILRFAWDDRAATVPIVVRE